MFCRNCGKEIPNGTNFCNHCGAAQNNSTAQDMQSAYGANETQHSSVNSQSMYKTPVPPKPKRKRPLRIIIPVVVVAVAFVIGYFATGANKLKQPTAFDTPSSTEFDGLESPSIKQDITEDSPEDYTGETVELEQKTFRVSGAAGDAWTTFHYSEDGVVASIAGSITYNDLSLIDADTIKNLKSDAEYAQGLLNESGVGPASYVWVQESSNRINVTYSFAELKSESFMAELAAAFIGFEAENGRITIESAEKAMTDFGYTLE